MINFQLSMYNDQAIMIISPAYIHLPIDKSVCRSGIMI